MKRDRGRGRERGESSGSMAAAAAASMGKMKLKGNKLYEEEEEEQPEAGMDELLAVLGYKVKSSDMAEVARKFERLEMMMMGTAQEDGFSLISNDTIHYNPADLSGWAQSMIEINGGFDVVQTPNSSITEDSLFDFSNSMQGNQIFEDNSEYDLRAIPGGAICNQRGQPDHKRMKFSLNQAPHDGQLALPPSSSSETARTMVIVDSQEAGVRLVHTLMACAEAIQEENTNLADALVKHVGLLAVSQSGPMRKVATYFAEGLARRIYKIYPPPQEVALETSYIDKLEMHFYETCPYLKFAHFTANQAIFEAFDGKDRVHVIDFSLKQGMQWPALLQALALRPGGPPAFRLTGIGPPQPDNTDALQQVGLKLAQLAEAIGVQFEFRGFVANSLADLDAGILEIRPSDLESVAVNSVFDLHRLLSRPGAVEKVLSSIKEMKPKIVTIAEQEANHNEGLFMDRFNEALHYYSTMFDSLESSGLTHQSNSQEDVLMTEVYLGKQICNVVASEGTERVERHEPLTRWRERMNSAGFLPAHLGSNAFKQASMLCALFSGGDGYAVEENDGCLMLGWHTRPLVATSAWQLAAAS